MWTSNFLFRQQKTNPRRNDETQEPNNNNAFVHPETLATIVQLRAEIKTVSDKQNAQNELLAGINTEMKEMKLIEVSAEIGCIL